MSNNIITNQSILNKARKDKFLLVLDVPKVLKKINSNTRSNNLLNLDKLQFSIFGTVVPKVTVPSESVNYLGQAYNITSQSRPAYSPITVGFNVDNNFDNYWVLWKWLSILNNPRESGMDPHFAKFKDMGQTNVDTIRDLAKNALDSNNKDSQITNLKYKQMKMMNDYTDYQTTITIYGLREYNEQIVKFDYYNAFITGLGDLKYDYKDAAEMDCNFEFVFNQLDVTLLENNSDIKV